MKKNIMNKISIVFSSIYTIFIFGMIQCSDPSEDNQGTQNTNNNNTIKDTQADLKKKEEKIIAYKKFIQERTVLLPNPDVQNIIKKSKDVKNITKDDINKIDKIIDERKKLEEEFKKINKNKKRNVRKLKDEEIRKIINDEKDKEKKENLNKLNLKKLKQKIIDDEYTKNGSDKYTNTDLNKINQKENLTKIIVSGDQFKKNVSDINKILQGTNEKLDEKDLKELFSTKNQEEVETIKQYLEKRKEAHLKYPKDNILKKLPIITKDKNYLKNFEKNLPKLLKNKKEDKLNKEIEDLIRSELINIGDKKIYLKNINDKFILSKDESDQIKNYKNRLKSYSSNLQKQKDMLQ